jgi:hypothetical protein
MDSQHTLPAMDSQYMQSHAAKHKKKAKLEMKLHKEKMINCTEKCLF